MPRKEKLVVGLDIGSTKVCAIVGEWLNDAVNIVGIGTSPSNGLKRGVVINMESTVESIKRAVEEAETMAGHEITSVYVGITGTHIQGNNTRGVINVRGGEVTPEDIKRVQDQGRPSVIQPDRYMVHILPQEYTVDRQDGIFNPIGMQGAQLEAKLHIVTGSAATVNNIIRCVQLAGLDVENIVLESLSSAMAVLTEEEKEQGVLLIDIGGGTTDMAAYSGKNIRYTYVLPVGGYNFTYDISMGLRIPFTEAEKLKIEHGTCLVQEVKPSETIEIKSFGTNKSRMIQRDILVDILNLRMEELFRLLLKNLKQNGFGQLLNNCSGIVLTGGGALLDGAVEIAGDVFGLPARIGEPHKIVGLADVVGTPMHATGVGLVLYGLEHPNGKTFKAKDNNMLGKILERMKSWFREVI